MQRHCAKPLWRKPVRDVKKLNLPSQAKKALRLAFDKSALGIEVHARASDAREGRPWASGEWFPILTSG
jgi:hypothetical protein